MCDNGVSDKAYPLDSQLALWSFLSRVINDSSSVGVDSPSSVRAHRQRSIDKAGTLSKAADKLCSVSVASELQATIKVLLDIISGV